MNFDKEEPANDAHNESLELILNEYHAKDSCMVINVGRERSIIKYLRSIGVQMLVDPVAKQDVYYKYCPTLILGLSRPIYRLSNPYKTLKI
jgi:hypothetical protein